MNMIAFLKHTYNKVSKAIYDSLEAPRSDKWQTVRKYHLQKENWCRICGGTDDLQVHHKMPFISNPSLELVESNLVTLCEKSGAECHLKYGHLGNWKQYNPNITEIAISPRAGVSINGYDNKIPNIQPVKSK
jgi:hypothetical protein